MLKKILLVLVVLPFLAIPAMAATFDSTSGNSGDTYHFKAYNWPVSFIAQPAFKIDVTMDVGLYFEISNRKAIQEAGIKLTQRTLDVYTGCSEKIIMQTNFDVVLGATVEFVGVGLNLGSDKVIKAWIVGPDYDCTKTDDAIDDGYINKNLSVTMVDCQKKKVFVKLSKVKVFELEFGKKVKIAEVTLTVKPGFEAYWTDP